MTPVSLAAYGAACFILFATPGPGTMTVVARTLQGGALSAAVYASGIFLGDVIILAGVVAGLSAVAQTWTAAATLAKFAAAGYLAFLAATSLRNAWRGVAPAQLAGVRRAGDLAAGWFAGLATPFSNPKPLLFYGAFVPAFFDVGRIGPADFAAMAAVMAALAFVAMGGYIWLADRMAERLGSAALLRWSQLLVGVLFSVMAAVLVTR